MRFHRYYLTVAALLAAAAPSITLAEDVVEKSATEVTVNVYEGPEECPDEDKVKPENYIVVEISATIDESSAVGQKGLKIMETTPFDFVVGVSDVIKGWDVGFMGLCKDAKATLIVPPEYIDVPEDQLDEAHPSGATIKFDVAVLDVMDDLPNPDDMAPPDVFKMIDRDGDGFLTAEEMDTFMNNAGADGTPQDFWDENDHDRDGKVSREEFYGPDDPFATDADDDVEEAEDTVTLETE